MRKQATGPGQHPRLSGDEGEQTSAGRLSWALDKLVTPVLTGAVLAVFAIVAPGWIAPRLRVPTCQDPRDLQTVSGVTATGDSKPADRFPRKGLVSYGPKNLVDGNTSTAWVEGRPGLGLGARFELSFAKPVDVQLVCVVNGYAESWDLYKRNSRARWLATRTDQGSQASVLDDAATPDRPAVYQELRVAKGTTSKLTVTLRSAYAAQRDSAAVTAYPDTSISEIEVWAAS